jgi:predicted CoA-binding protein
MVRMTTASDSQMAALLKAAKTIAVVGLSPDSTRPSNGIARYLQRSGFRVIPVNPAHTELLGETCYPNLAAIPEPVDIVDVFRRSEFLPDIAREAIAIGAKGLWMQLSVANEEAAQAAAAAGLTVVQDRCIMVEHMRLCESKKS